MELCSRTPRRGVPPQCSRRPQPRDCSAEHGLPASQTACPSLAQPTQPTRFQSSARMRKGAGPVPGMSEAGPEYSLDMGPACRAQAWRWRKQVWQGRRHVRQGQTGEGEGAATHPGSGQAGCNQRGTPSHGTASAGRAKQGAGARGGMSRKPSSEHRMQNGRCSRRQAPLISRKRWHTNRHRPLAPAPLRPAAAAAS